ncbi:MAG TPA: RES family NAD+ phosphorylase [Thermoanaerobaculia bacterium]|nr:RES family NAD+ phosphorylase [Thermoanaerobaculia bacterium]
MRCHDSRFGATEFNPGAGRGRFHPFRNPAGLGVPTLYGSDSLDGALSETVFHAVPMRGPGRAIERSALKAMLVSVLTCARDLQLAQLHGYGLRRLEVSRTELIESDADHYQKTVSWVQALHASDPRIDGLIWVSRQHDTSFALVLFGDRVRRKDLSIAEPPVPLYVYPGFEWVNRAAEQAGIAILAVPE